MELFKTSIMGQSSAASEMHSCEQCHGNHAIIKPGDEFLNVYESSLCLECHSRGSVEQKHAGFPAKVDNCGSCHTTAYNPEGNQDGLPGLIGTWTEGGIYCEECHGAGSAHVANPMTVDMKIDRDAAACGDCHFRGAVEEVNASGGFIQHHEQYEELFQSKHVTVDCVICHDPHTGVIQLRKADLPTTRTACENCHYKEEQIAKTDKHRRVDCIDCHMPRVTKSALGDPDLFSGDIRTHLMAIDPNQIGQFSEDGTTALSQLSLDFACRHCHNDDGFAPVKTDEELIEMATGYHTPVIEEPLVEEAAADATATETP